MNTEKTELVHEAVLPGGFRAAGVAAGLKKSGAPDMALLVSDEPASVAGVFTTNQVQSATVKLCRARTTGKPGRAIVINSGNANACTGERGRQDAERMAELTAAALGADPAEVYVCSTGHIGSFLPMDLIEKGITDLAGKIDPTGAESAVAAIMTTDTKPKSVHMVVSIEGRDVTISGIAKGAGMIEPNMATMLAFLMTDATVGHDELQALLVAAADQSFNRISVDGDRSTNDTVLFMANGASGVGALNGDHPEWRVFCDAVKAVCHDLAMQIMRDGEGVTKVVTIRVAGARTDEEADHAARSVGNSLLVKTSWVGHDPHWGRVMDALGYSSAKVQEDLVDISYGGKAAAVGGLAAGTPLSELQQVLDQPSITLEVDLHLGDGQATVYSCNCTEEYVRINR